MVYNHSDAIAALQAKVEQLEKENSALRTANNKKKCTLSNEGVDGVIFIVILVAVVTSLVVWLSNMPG